MDRKDWRSWYATAAWQRRRAQQLAKAPLCEFCLAEGRVTAATVCDHVEPHRGDLLKFRRGALRSLCKVHHDAGAKVEQARGYSTQVGLDGFPVDERHPVYRGKIV
jgi:5-methylcytosine-specific restriction protein A